MVTRTETYNDVSINHLDFNGLESSPKLSYRPIHRRQSVYILKHCKQEGIRANFQHGEIVIYSKRKIDLFIEIVKQSIIIASNTQHAYFQTESQCFKIGRKFIALGLNNIDTLYTTEDAFSEVVYYQFLGKIPVTKNIKIFSTLKKLKKHLEIKHSLIV